MGSAQSFVKKGRRLSDSSSIIITTTSQESTACQEIITEFLRQSKQELNLLECSILAQRYDKIINGIKGRNKLLPSGMAQDAAYWHQSLLPLKYVKVLGTYEQGQIVLFQFQMQKSQYILFERHKQHYNYAFDLTLEWLEKWHTDAFFREHNKICIELLKEEDRPHDHLYWVKRVATMSLFNQ